MQYDAEAWQKERNSWRTVVQLNLVRSVIAILSVIDAELGGEGPTREEEERPTFTDEHQVSSGVLCLPLGTHVCAM